MSALVAIVLFGLSFALLATQNTAAATFNLLGYTWTLPTYMMVFGALLVGFFISWIVSGVSTLGTWSSLHGKDRKIRESQQTVAQLQGRIRELELKIANLQGHNEVQQRENKPRNFLDRFRKNPAY